jgi:hypothetical protein
MAGKTSSSVLAMLVLLVCALSATVNSHATHYPKTRAVNCSGTPEALSYHVHIVYDLYSVMQTQAALAFREQTRHAFADVLTPDCDGRYDYGRLCLIDDHPLNTTLPNGPFPSGEWSLFTPLPFIGRVVQYFTIHRPLQLSFLLVGSVQLGGGLFSFCLSVLTYVLIFFPSLSYLVPLGMHVQPASKHRL